MLRLREHRVGRGWSQRELAQRASVSVETIGAIESGYRRPKTLTVRRIAAALQVNPAEIKEFTLRGYLEVFVRQAVRRASRRLKELLASKDVRYPLSSILKEPLRDGHKFEPTPGSPLDLALRELARRRRDAISGDDQSGATPASALSRAEE